MGGGAPGEAPAPAHAGPGLRELPSGFQREAAAETPRAGIAAPGALGRGGRAQRAGGSRRAARAGSSSSGSRGAPGAGAAGDERGRSGSRAAVAASGTNSGVGVGGSFGTELAAASLFVLDRNAPFPAAFPHAFLPERPHTPVSAVAPDPPRTAVSSVYAHYPGPSGRPAGLLPSWPKSSRDTPPGLL